LVKNKNIVKIQVAEFIFLRNVKACTRLDKIKNEDIQPDLNI